MVLLADEEAHGERLCAGGAPELFRGSLPAFGSLRGSKKSGSTSARACTLHPSSSSAHGSQPGSPAGKADMLRAPDYTFTTTRRALHMTSPVVGNQLMDEETVRFAMIPSVHQKARPKSASVNAAAWKAYGSPSARGKQRPTPPPVDLHPNPKTSFMDSLPGRPASVLTLGGGYQLPRPQSAPVQPVITHKAPKLTKRSPDIAGAKMAASPQLTLPTRTGTQGSANKADFRFAETLPTDPKALQVYQDMKRRLGSGLGTGSSPRSPGSSDRPPTASHASTDRWSGRGTGQQRTERFSSASVRTVHSMGLSYKPAVVSGFSAPEQEVALPEGGDSFRYSRLSQTSLSKLQERLKLAGYPLRPFSAPVQAVSAAPSAWQQDGGQRPQGHPQLGQSMSDSAANSYAPQLAPGRVGPPSLQIAVPGGDEMGGHEMPTVLEESLPTPTLETATSSGAGEADVVTDDTAEQGAADETMLRGASGSGAGAEHSAASEAAAPQPSQEGQDDLLGEGEDSGFVKEDEDGGGSGGEDEVEEAIARVGGALRSSLDAGSQAGEEALSGTAQEGEGGLALPASRGQHEGAAALAGELQEGEEPSSSQLRTGPLTEQVAGTGPSADAFPALPLGGGGSGNALDALYGHHGDGEAQDQPQGDEEDEDGRKRMLLLLGERSGTPEAVHPEPVPEVGDDAEALPSLDEDSGIKEDEGNDEFFDSPTVLSRVSSGMRPASGMRPTSARPTSARPTSGRPTSGRPTSGRPASGSSQSGATASRAGTGMGVILEQHEHADHTEHTDTI